MYARIFRPSKTAMQSGKNKAQAWVLEFEPSSADRTEPLMGWTASRDTLSSQVRMTFDALEAAVAYARDNNIPHQVMDRDDPAPIAKSYGDNFAYQRRLPWTH